MAVTIRNVRPEDAESIVSIYNYYIENTTITFEEQTLTPEQMLERINEISKDHPYLVCELDGKIAGYAYVSVWRSRSAFRYTAELSIYIDCNIQQQGLGTKLLAALLDNVRKNTSIHVLISFITLPNEPSIRLHEKFGFVKMAHYDEVGYKFDDWVDMGGWQLLL